MRIDLPYFDFSELLAHLTSTAQVALGISLTKIYYARKEMAIDKKRDSRYNILLLRNMRFVYAQMASSHNNITRRWLYGLEKRNKKPIPLL